MNSEKGNMENLDKLIVVSKHLFDFRVADARSKIEAQNKEIESLKLHVFWKTYSYGRFVKTVFLHKQLFKPRCLCDGCFGSGDEESVLYSEDSKCTWRPAFDSLLNSLGLEIEKADPATVTGPYPHCCETDTHFVIDREDDDDADYMFLLGKKLWSALSTKDPELEKYKKLMDSLWKTEGLYFGHEENIHPLAKKQRTR